MNNQSESPASGKNNKSLAILNEKIESWQKITSALLTEVKSLDFSSTLEIEKGIDLEKEVESFEVKLIARALELTGGNQTQAAQLLNIKKTTLNAKIKRYSLNR